MTEKYYQLQAAVEGTAKLMLAIINLKPEKKQAQEMKDWEDIMKPYRVECIRLHYELIETNQKELYDN